MPRNGVLLALSIPLLAIPLLAIVLLVISPGMSPAQGDRHVLHDPRANKPGDLLRRAEAMRAEDFSAQPESMQRILAGIRQRLDDFEQSNRVSWGENLITAWDTVFSVELQSLVFRQIALQLPADQRAAFMRQQVMTQHFHDGTTSTQPSQFVWLYNIEIFNRADERLAAMTNRLPLPDRVVLRGTGNCRLKEGTFNVVRNDHLLELSTPDHAAYFGTTSDRALWLHLNEERFGVIRTGSPMEIRVPDGPGQAFVLMPKGDGFAGTQWQNPDCRVELHPAKE